MKGIPKECFSRPGFWGKLGYGILNIFRSPTDVCLEYHKAVQTNPYTKATLSRAISLTSAQLLFEPLEYIGENISKFVSGHMRHIPAITVPFVWASVIIFGLCLIFARYDYGIYLPFNMGAIRPFSRGALPMPNNNQEAVFYSQGNTFHGSQDAHQLSHIRRARIKRVQLKYNQRSTRRRRDALANIQSTMD